MAAAGRRGVLRQRMQVEVVHLEREDCPLCRESYCIQELCRRSLAYTRCCEQAMCASCMVKQSKRCACDPECDKIVVFCAFCREVSPVTTLDCFLVCQGLCRNCEARDKREARLREEEALLATEARATPGPPSRPPSPCQDREGGREDTPESISSSST